MAGWMSRYRTEFHWSGHAMTCHGIQLYWWRRIRSEYIWKWQKDLWAKRKKGVAADALAAMEAAGVLAAEESAEVMAAQAAAEVLRARWQQKFWQRRRLQKF